MNKSLIEENKSFGMAQVVKGQKNSSELDEFLLNEQSPFGSI